MNAPAVRFVGYPDGPKQFIAELGFEVGTFTAAPGGKFPALTWHVPLKMRGDYRAEDLANYDPQMPYRTDKLGKVLCYGYTKAGERCSKRAVNRYPRCDQHGGRLHPLDKMVNDTESAANDAQTQSLSRFRQFQAGQITVDDLDDEELAMCGFRGKNGAIYRPKNIPRELAQAFTKAIYERAQEELRSLTVDAARTLGEIMRNKTFEPDIRLKSALSIIERNLGKTPQSITVNAGTGFDEVFEGIYNGSREASRNQRVQSERPLEIEGEIVESPGLESDSEDDRRNNDRDDEDPRDARLFSRDPAILAQSVEIKPFEYDLSDHTKEIKKATQKRYASRTLGVDLTRPKVPLIVEKHSLPNGCTRIRHINPKDIKVATPSKNAVNKRKSFTLSDFS
jgi:hypothetical protein